MDQSRDSQATSSKSKTNDVSLEDKWTRRGLFRFTFNIQTMDDKTNLGTKEAHDHAFSHKTSNWGWAQFAKRDHVYNKNAEVMRDDGFLISVTITSSPEKPKVAKPITHTVPPVLVQAMGSLLDDPEHSDVVFYLYPRRKSKSKAAKADIKKVYAIRKILAARSEYFRDMFESGFQEAEAEESSSEDETTTQSGQRNGKLGRLTHAPAHPQRSHHAAAKAEQANKSRDSDDDDEIDQYDVDQEEEEEEDEYEDENAVIEDSDEDTEMNQSSPPRNDYESQSVTQEMQQEDDPNEDEEAESEVDDEDEHEEEADVNHVAQMAEESIGSEQEGDGEATGDDAYTIAATSTSPRFSTVEIRQAGRRQSSGTYVDANSNHLSEATGHQLNRIEGSIHAKESSLRNGIGEETLMVEHLAAASPHQKRSSTSSPALSIATKGSSRGKRERVIANEANTVKKREAATKRPLHIHRRKRRKVAIVDSAYPTFKALLFFLYTDTVEFAPLTSSFLPSDVAADDTPSSAASQGALFSRRRGKEPAGQYTEEMQKARKKRKSVIESHLIGYPEKPSPCSAKAMYRLADKLDIPDLKQRAQEHIAMSLSIQNIVWEVFSGFTAHYPDILKMETDFLLKHWPQVKRINAMKSIFLRHSAHPGLAQVWPHLLECLEYRRPEVDEVEESSA